LADGSHVELRPEVFGEAAGRIKAECALTLREAIELLGCLEDGGDGSSYYETDGHTTYTLGEEIRQAFHMPDNATGASLERIARLLAKRGLVRAETRPKVEEPRSTYSEDMRRGESSDDLGESPDY
jgi:hypothetical protein